MATSPVYQAPDLCLPQWSLTDSCTADTNYSTALAAEALEIAGAPINVFRMLGVHEQGQLQDLTGSGNPISSGTANGYILADAFSTNITTGWASSQVGAAVTTSFIGYNFGTKKNLLGGERYDAPQPIRQEITTIRIKQGSNPENRILQARIERSDDGGVTWKRVDVVNLPNTNDLETIKVKQSGLSPIWRIVPLLFAGSATDSWVVEQLQLMNYTQTNLDNVQDMLFLENRDRDYADISVQIKGQYDLIDVSTELTKFGIDLPQQYIFTVSFARMVELLGRPVVIGDILELPSEIQYDQNLRAVRKWLEVTDTSWSQEGYTPGWTPILYRITANPAIASQENMDLFKSDKGYDSLSDEEFSVLDSPLNMLAQETSEAIEKKSREDTPETGGDTSGIRSGMSLHGDRGSYDGRDYDVEDAMPPNDQPYTKGPSYPQNPNEGDYHRMTYPTGTNLPDKLFQWNHIKNRWIYLETDRRMEQSSFRPSVRALLDSTTKMNLTDK